MWYKCYNFNDFKRNTTTAATQYQNSRVLVSCQYGVGAYMVQQ